MMTKTIITILLSTLYLLGTPPASEKAVKLAQKGKRIVSVLCDEKKLPEAKKTVEETIEAIETSHACSALSKAKLEAVAYYLQHQNIQTHHMHLVVPKDAKCPVCGMFVAKYPKWSAMMQHDGKVYYFDGVKDMMKYYIFDGDFPFDRTHISKMMVSDYYTIEAIPAKEAFYVLDADVFGPMGHELIPFKNEKSAKTFLEEHHGKKIVRFNEITGKMLMRLDGIVE